MQLEQVAALGGVSSGCLPRSRPFALAITMPSRALQRWYLQVCEQQLAEPVIGEAAQAVDGTEAGLALVNPLHISRPDRAAGDHRPGPGDSWALVTVRRLGGS